MRTGLGRNAVVGFVAGFLVAVAIVGLARCVDDDERGARFHVTRVEAPERILDESPKLLAVAARVSVERAATVDAYRQIQAFAAWLDGVARVEAERVEEPEPAPGGDRRRGSGSEPAEATDGSGRCGGNLPPCYVMARESGGDIRAENPISTASGKWQFLDSTWQRVTGLPGSASDYDEATQDQAAAELWAGGAGCSHWEAC